MGEFSIYNDTNRVVGLPTLVGLMIPPKITFKHLVRSHIDLLGSSEEEL